MSRPEFARLFALRLRRWAVTSCLWAAFPSALFAVETAPFTTPTASPQPPSALVNAWAFLLQNQQTPAELADSNTRRATLLSALSVLRSENEKNPSSGTEQIDAQLQSLSQELRVGRTADLQPSYGALEKLFDPAVINQARALAEQYRCPMHPEVVGKKGELCPKCGMGLSSLVRISLASPDAPPSRYTIKAQVEMDAPLQPGIEVKAHLILTSLTNGEPITLDQLREVHTRKIHLLLIDGSLVDYHHIHPTPAAIPGRYDFSFTPQKPGSYRLWADLQPIATDIQEFAMALMLSDAKSEPLQKEPDCLTTTLNGLHYTLIFDRPLKSYEPARATLHIVQDDGQPFAQLEPIMGAFAHIVGFREDRTTALHIHPELAQPLVPADRGGPDLHFRFYATKPGFYRLFVQVQRNGVQEFAPFAINVAPGPLPPGWEKYRCSSSKSGSKVFAYGIRTTETTLPEGCAGTAHRCADDGDPSRQTSRGLCRQRQQGDRGQG